MKLVISADRCWLQVVDAALGAALQELGMQSRQRLEFAAREAVINAMRVEEENGGGGESEIEIQLFAEDGWIELRVIDNGPGLPEGWKQKLTDEVSDQSVTGLSGRGLFFINKFVDELSSVRDLDGRHVLILRKRKGESSL